MKLGVALGSGGARGIAHVAFLEQIDLLGERPACLSGASIGALVGALYAGGMSADAMRDLVLGLSLVDVPRLVDFSGPRQGGIIKGRKIEDWIVRTLPVKRFEELAIPLKIVATDFRRAEQVVFDSGDLAPAIRASISIPGIFEPYEYEGRLLVDGGVVNPVPIDLLPGADLVVGIDVSGEKDPSDSHRGVPGRIEVLLGAYDIMGKIIAEERMRERKDAIYLRPALRGIGTGDFLRGVEILSQVARDAVSFRQELAARGFGAR